MSELKVTFLAFPSYFRFGSDRIVSFWIIGPAHLPHNFAHADVGLIFGPIFGIKVKPLSIMRLQCVSLAIVRRHNYRFRSRNKLCC